MNSWLALSVSYTAACSSVCYAASGATAPRHGFDLPSLSLFYLYKDIMETNKHRDIHDPKTWSLSWKKSLPEKFWREAEQGHESSSRENN